VLSTWRRVKRVHLLPGAATRLAVVSDEAPVSEPSVGLKAA
jgi:hypothetical protein